MPKTVDSGRPVKLFKNGRNQAVRIPREFELPGDEAVMRKEGARLIIELKPAKSLLAVLQGLKPISEDFAPVADLPPQAGRPLMRYLLDTNIVSDLVRSPQGQVAQKTRRVGEQRVCTSIIIASGLRS
jgi:antitoxin VapB